MQQQELKPAPGSKHRRKRVGRGNASGHGNYSGKGMKGQKARAGGGVRPAFEGGQLPLVKRLPFKRGFHNLFRLEYIPVNVARLAVFEANAEVTPETLKEKGIVKNLTQPIKILGDGELDRPLTVEAHKFSSKARDMILAAGGQVKEL